MKPPAPGGPQGPLELPYLPSSSHSSGQRGRVPNSFAKKFQRIYVPLVAQKVKNLPAVQEKQEIRFQFLDWEDPLE